MKKLALLALLCLTTPAFAADRFERRLARHGIFVAPAVVAVSPYTVAASPIVVSPTTVVESAEVATAPVAIAPAPLPTARVVTVTPAPVLPPVQMWRWELRPYP